MFQSFDDPPDPDPNGERLTLLRREMARLGIAGFLVPMTDEYQNEYIPPSAQRLTWLTGFAGSAGLTVVLTDQAALFVDGRYTLQAKAQIGARPIEILRTPEAKPTKWLEGKLKAGDRLGYDPRLHTAREVERLVKALAARETEALPLADNPIDAIWLDRPDPPLSPVVPHPAEFAGRDAAEKIAAVQTALREAKVDATLITSPASIAWLLNIRGNDVAHVPVPLASLLMPATGRPTLFIDERKVGDNVRGHLAATTDRASPDTLDSRLRMLNGAKVALDFDTASRWHRDQLEAAGATVVPGTDPCILPRAIKNQAEVGGSRAAHRRDGVALTRFLTWLDAHASDGGVDEIDAAKRLEAFRRDTGCLEDISFDSISGAGPNGAIVHYRVTRATNRRLEPGKLYLIDSGGQYQDGTTDVTRTVAIGTPTDAMRRHFTLVLKAHVALATARFPKGTRGQDLDPLVRSVLWSAGLDFDHGTGHGVGSYLSVHEGPARISRLGTAVLEPGMILSNEPGYYREGCYGIRIENLVLVTEAETIAGGERPMMGFETLTLAPIDRRLIDGALLSAEERAWIDGYHGRVREALRPSLADAEQAWLEDATAPLD